MGAHPCHPAWGHAGTGPTVAALLEPGERALDGRQLILQLAQGLVVAVAVHTGGRAFLGTCNEDRRNVTLSTDAPGRC
jgi:hypothetical protein